MRNILLLLLSFFFLSSTLQAQSKAKSTKAFVKELNGILKHSSYQHWAYDGTMVIDSPFVISDAGILSVSVHYEKDTTLYRIRMEAPVNKIIGVLYDLYYILEFSGDLVRSYESENNSTVLLLKEERNYFHIGVPENYGSREKLEKLWRGMKQHYP